MHFIVELFANDLGQEILLDVTNLACTKPYYFDVADDSSVCYVEKNFLSKFICKKLHDEVLCLNYDKSK